MTRTHRILIVTRRYWPDTDDLSLFLSALANRLKKSSLRRAANCQLVVVTPRWHRSWPTRIQVEEIPVVRLDPPPISALREKRYVRSLAKFFADSGSEFDAVVCGQSDWDALQAVQSMASQNIPVFVRFEPNDLAMDGLQFDRWNFRTSPALQACRKASVVIVTSQAAHQQIVACGIPAEKVVRYPIWRTPPIDRSQSAQVAARNALKDVNYELMTDSRTRVLLVPGALTAAWGIEYLIDSIWPLLDGNPSLKLWLLGDGPLRDRIYRQLKYHGVHRSTVMPGIFSSLEPVLQAADACLFPKVGCGMSWLLPTCMASGIPVLAARTQELVSLWGPAARHLTFDSDSSDNLRSELTKYLEDYDLWLEKTREASRFVRLQTWETDVHRPMHDARPHSLPDIFWDLFVYPTESMRLAE